MQTIAQVFKRFWNIPLYSNASYLIVGNGGNALFGFVYWVVAARLYPAADVGLASAAISAMAMLSNFSNLGLPFGVIRFLPGSGEKGKSIINFSITLTVLTTLLISLIFILGLSWWSPKLVSYHNDAVNFSTFVLYTIFTALAVLTDNIFVAERAAIYTMTKNLVFSILKLALVAVLAFSLKTYGIFNSWGIALGIEILLALFLFLPKVKLGCMPRPTLANKGMGALVRFSIGNNIAYFLSIAPAAFLPLIIVGRLGAESNAYFYAAWTIAATLYMIMTSISLSLFAEGSNEEDKLRSHSLRSLGMGLVIIAPVVILVIIFAGKILLTYGSTYSKSATRLLQLLTLASLPIIINQVYYSILMVRKRTVTLIIVFGLFAMVTLLCIYLLLPRFGILGAGISWLAGQTAVAIWATISDNRWLILLKRSGSIFPLRKKYDENQGEG